MAKNTYSRLHKITDDEVAIQNLRSLRQWRHSNALTTLGLGNLLGLSSGMISFVELHSEMVSANTYNLIAKYFGWSQYSSGRKIAYVHAGKPTPQLGINFGETETPKNSEGGKVQEVGSPSMIILQGKSETVKFAGEIIASIPLRFVRAQNRALEAYDRLYLIAGKNGESKNGTQQL